MAKFFEKWWKFIVIIITVFLIFIISMTLIFTLNGKEKYNASIDDGTYKFKTTLKVDYNDHQSNMKVKNQGGIPIYFGTENVGGGHKDEIGGGETYESGWTADDQIIYGGGASGNTRWHWDINYRLEFATLEDGLPKYY